MSSHMTVYLSVLDFLFVARHFYTSRACPTRDLLEDGDVELQ
jgi:hypothetical protein